MTQFPLSPPAGGRRKPRVQFTLARRQRFLDALALSCNVTAAAAYAGVDRTTCYCCRASDPEFEAQWRAAVGTGYDRLEMLVLEHGGAGMALDHADPDRVDPAAPHAPPPFDFDKALQVLRIYREKRTGAAPQGMAPRRYATREETNAALIKGLTAARKRLGLSDDA